jgi:hypothetical protein
MKSAVASVCLGLLLPAFAAAAPHLMAAARAAVVAPIGSLAATGTSPMNPTNAQPQQVLDAHWLKRPLSSEALKQLGRLRDEGLTLQKADGGKLTPEHRAYLQHKFDEITASAH